MIEELRDYLIRVHGVAEDMADEIHDWYYEFGLEGVRACGIPGEFDPDEMEGLVWEWAAAVGESTPKKS